MLYPFLASIFFLTILLTFLLIIGFIIKPRIWRRNIGKIKLFLAAWYIPYFVFIIFFTGPQDVSRYPPQKDSPYKLPWKAGVKRFVPQGNRSFTSHRGLFLFAWDFLMPTGTEILAARGGRVVKVLDSYDGIGLTSNFITIEHEDGTRAIYAHIQNRGALVKVGDTVVQGQPIALSGMVGQAPGPHLHFAVLNQDESESIPISFSDVPGGIPFAAHFYTSGNEGH